MPKLSQVKARDLVKVILKLGFNFRDQSGSHAVYVHSDGRRTTVPITLRKPSVLNYLRKLSRKI